MDEHERNQYGRNEFERRHDEQRHAQSRKTRQILGTVLALLLIIGGIWAWNAQRNQRQEVSAVQQQVRERTAYVRGTEETRGNATRQTGATPMQTVKVIQVDRNAIQALRKGQPVNFYLDEFRRKGYNVTPIHRMEDHVTYVVRGQVQEGDVRRIGEEGALVTLHIDDDDAGANRVSRIETADYKQASSCPPMQKAQNQ